MNACLCWEHLHLAALRTVLVVAKGNACDVCILEYVDAWAARRAESAERGA